ncbi:MAG: hypothetical protein AB1659_02820 [Thermodesulfobacteriota bacterium]
MKNRIIIAIVFFLAVIIGTAPVFAGYYGYRHYRSPRYPRYHHHHYYHGGDVFLGTVLGLTLGAILLAPPPPPPVYIYREYAPAAPYRERYGYEPNSTSIYREPVYNNDVRASADPTCLQTREYTTKIIIDGKEVEAYGTKCLRPDGSWSFGPAQTVPEN